MLATCWNRIATITVSDITVTSSTSALLAPTSSIIPLPDNAFDHRMYLSLAALVCLALVLLGLRDVRQSRHSILRNYPVIGHVRFLLEFLRVDNWTFFGIPTAMLISAVAVVSALGILVLRHRGQPPVGLDPPASEGAST